MTILHVAAGNEESGVVAKHTLRTAGNFHKFSENGLMNGTTKSNTVKT